MLYSLIKNYLRTSETLYDKLYHLNKNHKHAVWKFLVLKSGFSLWLKKYFGFETEKWNDPLYDIQQFTNTLKEIKSRSDFESFIMIISSNFFEFWSN